MVAGSITLAAGSPMVAEVEETPANGTTREALPAAEAARAATGKSVRTIFHKARDLREKVNE